MADPEPGQDADKAEFIREQHHKKVRLSGFMEDNRTTLFKIYFLVLIGLSSVLLVYYWPQITMEEKITYLNSSISNDTMQIQNIVKSESKANNATAEMQKAQLEKEITNYKNMAGNYTMKLQGKIPLDKKEFFLIGTVKNFGIVMLAGTMGGSIATFRSFYNFLGNMRLKKSWTTMYLFRPWEGTLMGLISYILIRSGIYVGVPGAPVDNANLFIVAGGAIVAGLYSGELYDKFHEVFDTLFRLKSQSTTGGITPVPRYPTIIEDIVDNALVPESDIKIVFYKDIPPNANNDFPSTFTSGQSYWMIELAGGSQGIYWIRDLDKTVILHYTKT